MGSIMKRKGFRLQFHGYNDSCLLSLNVHETYLPRMGDGLACDSFWGSLISLKVVLIYTKTRIRRNGRSWSLIEVELRSHILLALNQQASNVDTNFNNFFDAVGVLSSMGDWICLILGFMAKSWMYRRNKLID